MSEMTTSQAAVRLGVSQRQVQRLVDSGQVPGRRTAGDAWVLDALAVNALARLPSSRGRPWSSAVAWAALWMLSGLDSPWIDGRTRSRLAGRLRLLEPESLVNACRRRAEVVRCRVSPSLTSDLSDALVLSGVSSARPLGLADDPTRVEGYCDPAAWSDLRSRLHLADDPRGNATVRVTSFTDALRTMAVPTAVVAVDLAESYEARERTTGLHALKRLLG